MLLEGTHRGAPKVLGTAHGDREWVLKLGGEAASAEVDAVVSSRRVTRIAC